jgi:hypothetical protein
MEQTGHDPEESPVKREKTWVEQYLGDDWTEVEPGIYRLVANEGQTTTDARRDARTS